MVFRSAKLPLQPCLGQLPVPRYRVRRDLERLGGLFRADAAIETQLYHSASSRVHGGKRLESVVEGQQLLTAIARRVQGFFPRAAGSRRAATLSGAVTVRVINQDAPHQLRGQGEELRAILPTDTRSGTEPQPRLIDQGRGLEGAAWALLAHVTVGEAMELVMDERV
jgi:hypothetical protein